MEKAFVIWVKSYNRVSAKVANNSEELFHIIQDYTYKQAEVLSVQTITMDGEIKPTYAKLNGWKLEVVEDEEVSRNFNQNSFDEIKQIPLTIRQIKTITSWYNSLNRLIPEKPTKNEEDMYNYLMGFYLNKEE